MLYLREGLRGIHSLFFPRHCPYCSLEGVGSCEGCLDQWRSQISIRYIEKIPILSMHPYDPLATSIVLAAKERGEREARRFISTAVQFGIDEVSKRIPPSRELIAVTIPASKRAIRNRGEDFLQEILKGIHPINNGTLLSLPILRWRREVKDQSSLRLNERVINLRDSLYIDQAMVIQNGLRSEGVGIILIDDVLTTGATMEAAISAISHSSLGTSSLLAGVTACYSVNPRFA